MYSDRKILLYKYIIVEKGRIYTREGGDNSFVDGNEEYRHRR